MQKCRRFKIIDVEISGKYIHKMQDILNDLSTGIVILLTKFREGIAPGGLDGGSVLRYLGRATVTARCYERSAFGYLLQLDDPGKNQEMALVLAI